MATVAVQLPKLDIISSNRVGRAGHDRVTCNRPTLPSSKISYHEDKDSQYVLPNHSIEHARLDAQAAALSCLMHGRVLHAPVRDGPNVRMLDIGCGTGFVSSSMAAQFPQAECCGVDLSLVPHLRPRQPNLRFFQGNVTTQGASQWRPNDAGCVLPRDHELFDYVFSRLLICGISDWRGYIQTQYYLLKPGGWAEIHDLDQIWYNENDENMSDGWTWLRTITDICEQQKGLDFRCGSNAAQRMRDVGFVDVQVVRYMWGYGASEEPGPAMRAFSESNVEAQPKMLLDMIERVMTTGLEPDLATPELIAQMQRDMVQDLRPELGKHMWMYVTIGRKPDA